MAAYPITLIPGDGIGPEITSAVVNLLQRTDVDIDWDYQVAGQMAVEKTGASLPKSVLDSIIRNGIALKGPIATPISDGFRSVNVELRKQLNLYANVRPIRSIPGIKTRYNDDLDLIVVRENTEDLYIGLEHHITPNIVESLKIITAEASQRIARFAFSYARKKKRRRITAVHKANILKLGDGLFLKSIRTIAQEFKDIEYDECIVDAACMHLVMNPKQFDILLLPNLYGDIVSDLCAGLVGGLGLVPSANLGKKQALFEAVHGTAPDIAGQQKANPTALLLSTIWMLEHLNENKVASQISSALKQVLKEGRTLTGDLGGTASTIEFSEEICRKMDALA